MNVDRRTVLAGVTIAGVSTVTTIAHDFGGHRAEALDGCNRAIRQLQLALQFDRR